MSWKWKPNKSQAKEFAMKMQDPEFKRAYEERKAKREERRRANSQFSYASAGGMYIPTKEQHDYAFKHVWNNLTPEQEEAFHMVIYGYSCQEKIHHDHIHIVNEYIYKIR